MRISDWSSDVCSSDLDVSPVSPEERRRRGGTARVRLDRHLAKVRPGSWAYELIKRVLVGTWSDGFIHAGNIAYPSLLPLLPFFILHPAVAPFFVHPAEGMHNVVAFLRPLPPAIPNLTIPPYR